MIWGKRVRENTLSFFLNQKNANHFWRAVISVRSIQ